MPAKFKANGIDYQIIEVKLNKTASVTQNKTKDLADLWKMCTDLNKWSVSIANDGRVIDGHPDTPGHPGHVDGKNWKMNIEKGNGSKDRLFLKNRTFTVVDKGPASKHIKISGAGYVETDTH